MLLLFFGKNSVKMMKNNIENKRGNVLYLREDWRSIG